MSSIAIVDSPSQTPYSIGITQWLWFDLMLISVGARKSKTRPKIGWPPWVTRVLELKHLGVYALQHKLGDPFPQERADRSAARSMAWPARRRALWVVLEVKRTQCTATILWPCDVGLRPWWQWNHTWVKCVYYILRKQQLATSGNVNNINLTHIKSYTQSVDTNFS